MHAAPPISLSLRQQLPQSETERHAVRTEDEVKMDAEDGNEPQRHQAEALQSPSHVLNSGLQGTEYGAKCDVDWLHLCCFPSSKTLSTESSTAAEVVVACSLAERIIKLVDHLISVTLCCD